MNTAISSVLNQVNSGDSLVHYHTTDPDPLVAVGGVLVEKDASVNMKKRDWSSYVLPRNTVSSAVLQSGQTDVYFDIPHDQIDFLDQMYLEYTITNSHASNTLGLIDAWTMIDYIQIICNGNIVTTQYGYSIRCNNLSSVGTEKLASILPGVGINNNGTTYVSNISIAAASGTQQFNVPLHTILDRSNIPLWMPQANFQLLVRWKTGSQILLTTTSATIANVGLSDLKLLLDGERLEAEVRQHKELQLLSAPVMFRYVEHNRNSIAFGSVTSGTQIQQNITVSGHMLFCWVQALISSAANESLATSQALTSLEILSNGSAIHHTLGDNGFTTTRMRRVSPSHFNNPQFIENGGAYYISIAEHPLLGLINSSNTGTHFITGQTEALRIIPAFTNASVTVNMYCMMVSNIIIDYKNRTLKINRSTIN
jgi:hypothetical protein